MTEPTRRTVLAGAAGLSATAALTACGGDSGDGGDPGGTTNGNTGGTGSTATSGASGALAALADIPVGGGKIFEAEKVVVTQPTDGEVKGFSTVCTHQGCAVNKIENGLIRCPCHSSGFRIADGSVETGPAPKPLVSVNVKVVNGQVMLG